MTDRPVVLHADLLAGGDDEAPEPAVRDGRRRVVGLLLAAVLGFAAAQLVADAEPDVVGTASLALVVGGQPNLERTADDPPSTGLQVVLVNTGPRALRLAGATVDGTALAWDVDRPLEPSRQAAALLRDEQPCDGPLDELSGADPEREVRVSMRDEETGDRLPDVLLALPPTVGRLYDDHVRWSCALPRLQEAIEVFSLVPEAQGDELVVAIGLQTRSVRDVQVVELASAVDGLTVRLTAADGRPVPVPLTVPGRPRSEIDQGFDYDDPSSTPYRLHLTADAAACPVLRGRSGIENVVVRTVDPQEPEVEAERPVPVDLTPLVERVCPPTG